MLRGHIDRIDGVVAGWAYDDRKPNETIEVAVFVNGLPTAVARTGIERPDLAVLNTGQLHYGFQTESLPQLTQDANVFATYDGDYIVPGPSARESSLVHLLAHAWIFSRRFVPPEMVESGPSLCSDPTFGRRMIDALLHGLSHEPHGYGAIWGALRDGCHGEVVALAERGDAQGLLDHLAVLGRQPFALGFFDGPDADTGARNDPAFRMVGARVIFDRFLSLSEALGCSRVENPEQGPWSGAITTAPDALFRAICQTLGLRWVFGSVGGYWGLQTSLGVVNARMLDAIHFAARIVAIRRQFGLAGVTEIGGGAGLAAAAALELGCCPYRIVDLPTVSLAQAYTLRARTDLLLDGEPFHGEQAILTSTFANDTPRVFDMLVNTDSLPEIDTAAALAYLEHARRAGYRVFLSINQESGDAVGDWRQNKVGELTAKIGGYTLLGRHRDWMRPGYVEELYAIAQ